jgi:hypothetical protein
MESDTISELNRLIEKHTIHYEVWAALLDG